MYIYIYLLLYLYMFIHIRNWDIMWTIMGYNQDIIGNVSNKLVGAGRTSIFAPPLSRGV